MSHTVTIRVPKELAAWLDDASARTGVSQGKLIREHLERARSGDVASKKFMRLAGSVRSARNLSTRKGFSKP
jgi:hypothetical protein